MNSRNNTMINRPPTRPQGARKLTSKVEAAEHAASGWTTDRRVETDTERIAVLGYN